MTMHWILCIFWTTVYVDFTWDPRIDFLHNFILVLNPQHRKGVSAFTA